MKHFNYRMMPTILSITQNFFATKMLFALVVIATSVGPAAFAQRTKVVDAKGTIKTTGNIVTESATEPTTPVPIQGDVWFDTTANLVKVWEGSMWKIVASTNASDLADDQTIETFTVDDATQVVTLGLEDDGGADKTIDLSAAITAGETDTSLAQNATTGVITYAAEDGLDDTANVVSTATGNLLSVGADGGAFINQAGVNEPWFGVDDNAAATLNTENIYQMGNVGIGTNTPVNFGGSTGSRTLHVKSTHSNGDAELVLDAGTNSMGANPLITFAAGGTQVGYIRSMRSGPGVMDGGLRFATHDGTSVSERLAILNNGNVGIGIIPTQKLDVDGNARIRGALYDTNNKPGTVGAVLTSTASGTSWLPPSSTVGVSAGYRAWEFASSGTATYLTTQLGFLPNTWIPIPFNSTPGLINTTGKTQSFSFNADGSIGLEATSVYRISASISVYRPGYIATRLVGVNPSTVLAQSTESYSLWSNPLSSIDGVIVSPSVSGNYRVEFYYTNSGYAYFPTATMRHNQIIPRATFQIEVLK